MGGTRDQVRGKSKIETYLAYVDLVGAHGDTFQDRNPIPSHKKQCKREMVQDLETGEWVLHYRLHT
jgi:hypothetical protein